MNVSESNAAMGDRVPSLELLREELTYAEAMVSQAEMNSEERRRRMLDEWQPKVSALRAQIKELAGEL